MALFPTLFPALPDGLRKGGSGLLRSLSRTVLRIARWRFEGGFPAHPKFVLIVAPHTSNWDFVVGVLAKWALELRVSWLGKHTLFRPPFGTLLRGMGGIPVDRARSQGAVDSCIQAFARARELVLALSPEGTRKGRGEWRSGFYRIATGAGVPIVPVGLDFRARVIQLFPAFLPTGDFDADLAALKARFQGVSGLRVKPSGPG